MASGSLPVSAPWLVPLEVCSIILNSFHLRPLTNIFAVTSAANVIGKTLTPLSWSFDGLDEKPPKTENLLRKTLRFYTPIKDPSDRVWTAVEMVFGCRGVTG